MTSSVSTCKQRKWTVIRSFCKRLLSIVLVIHTHANANILQGGKMARAKFGTIFGSPALNQDKFACGHSESAPPSITL